MFVSHSLQNSSATPERTQLLKGEVIPFRSVTFLTARGYRLEVKCLHDVARALALAWPDKSRESYRRAARLAGQAAEGWCTHTVAYDAFVAAATEQERIMQPRKLRSCVAQEPAAIEEGNFETGASALREEIGPNDQTDCR